MHPDQMPLLDLPGAPEDHRIVVAMSGGVDSSVVAALLHHQGYDVVGVTLQLYDHGAAIQKKGACCAGQDIYDARKVADQMGFPHFVLDYENRFRESVIDNFVETYLQGATPIPCVQCNMEVKFKDLLEAAKDFGASAMATGHYIQRHRGAHKTELHRGIDHNRDQSYFLYGTTQEQLDFLHFPLGGLEKSQTRMLAEYFGLVVSDKPDSQDICFVPEGKYTDVIAKKRPDALKQGEIYHIDGRFLGHHRGIVHYTIGQRRGLGLPGGTTEPLFVIKLDADMNRIYVGPEAALKRKYVLIDGVNWIGDNPIPEEGLEVAVKLRSTRPPKRAVLYPQQQDGAMKIYIPDGEKSVSPGQAAVFYETDANFSRLLGGGRICAALDAINS
ncbi:MAG: tRNA 2-thiouridine(34) synthase MnmA [Pseudomonadota bacterium]